MSLNWSNLKQTEKIGIAVVSGLLIFFLFNPFNSSTKTFQGSVINPQENNLDIFEPEKNDCQANSEFLALADNLNLAIESLNRTGIVPGQSDEQIKILAEGVDTFVDVGANIGEFGLVLSGDIGVTYVGFEPDPSAFLALEKNAPNGVLINKAVSDYEGESIFYLATSTADSSLHLPTVTVDNQVQISVTTLDAALREAGILKIDVLKVEAEGSEPEVLRGAKNILRQTSVCVVDAGPEKYGASTAPECIKILQMAGFELLDLRFPRGILVFENSHRKPEGK
jgi:FkbM family methyltransferase